MWRVCLLIFVILGGCGRPLTPNEIAFADTLFGPQIDTQKVRFVNGHMARAFTVRYQTRPRVTCMERVFPPPKEEYFTTSPGAIAVFNKVFFRKDMFLPDYGYAVQGRGNLYALMLFAHEMTHIWQWQNRDRTGYHPLKAASEHKPGHDPYLFDLDSQPEFLSFPYEQQAAIVEEYVCCRALAPQAPRTQRLHGMIAREMPLARIDSLVKDHAFVPWKGAKQRGICS
ncbi:hypothetical protein ACSSNL_02280 [Thalassobius sp. S69A]|uniref:hypothetical protein n=1 Tax=unclassified Thalassovita TaxID=2619711 RepID=UPI000C393B1A|nr:hypothetical protein [Paracoccaceae bacterium]